MSDQTWEDRVRQGAYNYPPDGNGNTGRILFDFEDVQRTTPLRTTIFSFAGVDNDYVQQNGFGSRTYPLRCYFTGAQCDLLATAFEAVLSLPGIGSLEHPLYGTIPVVPVGDITRRDDLKTAANQAVVEVTFWTTTGAVYPSSADNAQNEIFAAIADFNFAAAQAFVNSVSIDKAVKRASLLSSVNRLIMGISNAMTSVSGGMSAIHGAFFALQQTAILGIDVLVGQPQRLAQQLTALIQYPSQIQDHLRERLASYQTLQDDTINSRDGNLGRYSGALTLSPNRQAQIANGFLASNLVASGALTGAIGCTNQATIFTTRPQAIAAAAALSAQFDQLIQWIDEGYTVLSSLPGVHPYQVDTGEMYEALQRATALALGNLINISFSLVPERAIVLEGPRTIIDLCAQLYPDGNIDDQLDFLINTNNLSGSEILLLSRGRKIVYYDAA